MPPSTAPHGERIAALEALWPGVEKALAGVGKLADSFNNFREDVLKQLGAVQASIREGAHQTSTEFRAQAEAIKRIQERHDEHERRINETHRRLNRMEALGNVSLFFRSAVTNGKSMLILACLLVATTFVVAIGEHFTGVNVGKMFGG